MCVTWVTVSEDPVGHRHCPVLVQTVIRAIDVRVEKVTTSQDFACLVCYKHMKLVLFLHKPKISFYFATSM